MEDCATRVDIERLLGQIVQLCGTCHRADRLDLPKKQVRDENELLSRRFTKLVVVDLKRKQVLKRVFQCLAAMPLKFSVVQRSSNDIEIQFETNQEHFKDIHKLEDSLMSEGIEFDTGYNVKKHLRIWRLDASLNWEGKPANISSHKGLEEMLQRLNESGLKYKVINQKPGEMCIQINTNQEKFENAQMFEEYFKGQGYEFSITEDPGNQIRIWNLQTSMNRRQTIREILLRLVATLEYDIISSADGLRVQFDTNQKDIGNIFALENLFREECITFDIKDDVAKKGRIWLLNTSLKVGGKPPSSSPMKKRIIYKVGDVLQVPLDEEEHMGYGRILLMDPPIILVEFYKVVSKTVLPLETFQGMDWFLRRYTEDAGIITDKTWKIIGNIPVGEFTLPLLWHKEYITEKYLLFRDPIYRKNAIETSMEEIQRLRAQSGEIAGYKLMEKVLVRELKTASLL